MMPVTLELRVHEIGEHVVLKTRKGETYFWKPSGDTSPLFDGVKDEYFTVHAKMYIDIMNSRKWLWNVRVR
jgi:hypothetical protein